MPKPFRTTRAVHFTAGTVLALNASQAATRSHLLTELDDDLYRADQPLVFKAGEIIGLGDTPAKGEAGLEPVEAEANEGDLISDDEVLGDDAKGVKPGTRGQAKAK